MRQAPLPDVHSGKHRGAVDDDAIGAAYAAEVLPLLASFARQEKHEAAKRAGIVARRAALHARRQAADVPAPGTHADAASDVEGATAHVSSLDIDEEALLFDNDDDGLTAGCGAFFCESVISCGGQVVPPAGYLRRVYSAVRAAGGVCIADEVQVGFGRVGTHMWGFQLAGADVVPDIVTLGKPIGNGYPIALVVTTPQIAASFAREGMTHFNTFGGQPPAARAALATMHVLQRDGLQARAAATGALLRDGFSQLAQRHACIGSVRGVGLMIGVEFIRAPAPPDDARAPWPEAAEAVVYAMLRRRILLSTDGMAGNVIKLKPPMVFDEHDARRVLDQLESVLDSLDAHVQAHCAAVEAHRQQRSLVL